MKKFYIGFTALVIIGISAGIIFLTVIRPGTAELPKDVTMIDAYKDEVDFAELPKKAKLVEFMYTQCPDVCPITTLEMSKLRNTLEKEGVFGEDIEFITITVDPKRDDVEVMKEYASRFEVDTADDGWYFLTGSADDTEKVADALGFLYRDPGTGNIIHSTYTYLLDKDDNLVEKFTMGESFDTDKVYKRIMRTIK